MGSITIPTSDGFKLAANPFSPSASPKAVVVLPKGVIYLWAQWCKSPHDVIDRKGNPIHDGYDMIRASILSMSFTDDEMMSRR